MKNCFALFVALLSLLVVRSESHHNIVIRLLPKEEDTSVGRLIECVCSFTKGKRYFKYVATLDKKLDTCKVKTRKSSADAFHSVVIMLSRKAKKDYNLVMSNDKIVVQPKSRSSYGVAYKVNDVTVDNFPACMKLKGNKGACSPSQKYWTDVPKISLYPNSQGLPMQLPCYDVKKMKERALPNAIPLDMQFDDFIARGKKHVPSDATLVLWIAGKTEYNTQQAAYCFLGPLWAKEVESSDAFDRYEEAQGSGVWNEDGAQKDAIASRQQQPFKVAIIYEGEANNNMKTDDEGVPNFEIPARGTFRLNMVELPNGSAGISLLQKNGFQATFAPADKGAVVEQPGEQPDS